MKETYDLLVAKLKEGYCLHGSPRKLDELEPRPARCNSGKKANCQLAVYATPDDARIACLRAMFANLEPRKDRCSSYSCSDGKTLVVDGENLTFKPGYVYVLPTNTFSWFEDEYISRVPVQPHLVVPVTPEIIEFLPDLDLRIPVPTAW